MKGIKNVNSANTWRDNPEKIILFDNGSYEIKHSTASSSRKINLTQNAKYTERVNTHIAPYYIDDIKNDFTIEHISTIGKNFNRPLSRGLLYDVDLQLDIWERILSTSYKMDRSQSSYAESLFMFTHAPLAPDEVIEGYFQIIFEYFGFDACFKAIPHLFSAIDAKEYKGESINNTVQLVIDSGFSSTTIVPILNDRPVHNATKRIDISGKLLTNLLRESLVNTIDLDLRREFYLANLIKEEMCFVSLDFINEMKVSSLNTNILIKNKKIFILPEYRTKSEDFLKKVPNEKYQIEMNHLRFTVPEVLFNPNITGMDFPGIKDTIIQSVNECSSDYRNLLVENIVLSGGNTKFPNFAERLKQELRPCFDSDLVKDIHTTTGDTLEGMKTFASNIDNLKDMVIYKQEYEEIGFNVVWKTCY